MLLVDRKDVSECYWEIGFRLLVPFVIMFIISMQSRKNRDKAAKRQHDIGVRRPTWIKIVFKLVWGLVMETDYVNYALK